VNNLGLIRSALFVPGNRLERVDKALATEADAVIIDLEDAVPSSQKDQARSDVAQKLANTSGHKIIVRVNGLDTPEFARDLKAVADSNLSGLMVPKIEGPGEVALINEALLKAEAAAGLQAGIVPVIALVETAKGVENISQIAAGQTEPARLYTVAFGAADYSLDLGIELTMSGDELFYARSRLPIACRAHDLAPPIDTPFMIDLKDIPALKADTVRAKQLGFMGKLCIHPNQIEPVNAIFSPGPNEIAHAEKIIQAYEESEAKGLGAIQVDGKFVDLPVVERARRTLRLASAGS
jgi:citrate lyase subunit beta / citryl-CoA lyase